MKYNWEQKDWRAFRYDEALFTDIAFSFMSLAGQSLGYMNGLSGSEQAESVITILVKEAIKTSSIEGELISRGDLISSIRKNLGYATPSYRIKDKRSEGIATLLVKAREKFDDDISEAQFFEWHILLMSGNTTINSGTYRTHIAPMQVISGTIGKEEVHFEAPPSAQVPYEMGSFIRWFNATKPSGETPISNVLIRASIAHLYFETIHPFEDGNGRIGRVIAEKALAQGLKRPILMSLSTAIEANKKAYYASLKKAQRTNNVSEWIQFFSQTIITAQKEFIETINFLLKKTHFFDKHKLLLNEAQMKVLGRMLEEGEENFIGGLNTRKYQSIGAVSKSTATRHLQDLVEKRILLVQQGGRSTHYTINWE